MKRRWRKIRYRLEWFGLVLLTNFVPLVPRRGVARLSRWIGLLAFRFDSRGRTVALANIAAAFGDQYTAAQRTAIARTSYCNFSRTVFDLFWAKALTRENYRRYIKVENAQVLHELRARGESAVMVCIHHGNFEWTSLATGFEGTSAMIVTENFKNQRLTDFFKNCRERSGHRIISQDSSMLRLLKHARKGGVAGLLVDLNLRPSEAATVIDAFGMKMCVTFLHAILVQRGPARLVPAEGRSLPDGTCQVVFHEPLVIAPDATFQQIAQQCWNYFEPTIRAHPEEWLWAYRHWRYKPAQAQREYPFYATVSPEFDRLLAPAGTRSAVSRAA
jgi:Kdo2-lipid IVA lauroyltransferase/acyltransferase